MQRPVEAPVIGKKLQSVFAVVEGLHAFFKVGGLQHQKTCLFGKTFARRGEGKSPRETIKEFYVKSAFKFFDP